MSSAEQKARSPEEMLAQLRKDAENAKLIGTITGLGTIGAVVGVALALPVVAGAVTAALVGTAGTGLTALMLGRKTSDEKQIKQIQEQSQQAQGLA